MSLVTISEVKAHLNIPSSVTTYDAELQGFIDAAQTVVENIAGVVTTRVITGEVHDGGGTRIVTLYTPVQSVQSITEYIGLTGYPLTSQPEGSTTSNYGYELTDPSGVITRRGAAGVPIPFQGGPSGVVINYTAGYATLPANIRLGTLELIRHWWQRTQQGGRPSFGGGGDDEPGATQVAGYLVPNFVLELLTSGPSSSRFVPGIA